MSRRRIALFTGNYVTLIDGVSLTLRRLVRHLNRRGHNVIVFAPDSGASFEATDGDLVGLPSVPLPIQPEYRLSWRLPSAARRRLDAMQPDLIHLASPDLVAVWAQRYARRRNIPVVASFHSNIAEYLRYVPVVRHFRWIVWLYLRWFYKRCLQVYVPTTSIADKLRDHGIRDGLRLWEHAVDPQRFTPSRRDLAFRRRHGVDDDELLVLFVGRLRWEKGLRLMASVFEHLGQSGLRCRTMIVGAGVGFESMRRCLPDTIFTGQLVDDELAIAYASADLFFFPSAVETFGMVILEAMASGLACVCADAPGSSSVVVDKVTGVLARRDDPVDFLNKTMALIKDEARRRSLASEGLKRAHGYSWETVNDQLLRHYEDAIRGAR